MSRRDKIAILTGGAGFIGSHLLESLLADHDKVLVIDNLSTGTKRNLDDAVAAIDGADGRIDYLFDDLGSVMALGRVFNRADCVYHLAALGSVPRSIDDPISTFKSNVSGFQSVLEAVRISKNRPRLVYASSSSVYGDSKNSLKVEGQEGRPLSPYAATKKMNEDMAHAYSMAYGIEAVGLRFFNVFGPRQNPSSTYSAVIPKWANAMIQGDRIGIYGSPEKSRDFTPVHTVVAAIRRAGSVDFDIRGRSLVMNVGAGGMVSLRSLFDELAKITGYSRPFNVVAPRPGDPESSIASTNRAERYLGIRLGMSPIEFKSTLTDVVNYIKRKNIP